mmetsp:Transcript_23553/g.48893  ORF Transcript_23553/g.48893 Transcript_23553/m.48893 type:complete len:282 (-) Transcript_23553:1223-2068(-)
MKSFNTQTLVLLSWISGCQGFLPLTTPTPGSLSTTSGAKPLFSSPSEAEDEPATSTTTTTPNDESIIQPFLPAADPQYKCTGPVGEGSFVASRTGGPTDDELTNENMLKIVLLECNDLEVNTLVWKCLGYRFDTETNEWKNDEVFPNFRERYPTPPDFIGMQRIYSKDVDEPSLRSNQALVRSIPLEYKQCLKPALKPLGWNGYKMMGLTPKKTRRAQCANWLIYYRDHLYGYSVEELREQRAQKKAQEAVAEQERLAELVRQGKTPDEEEEFRPPVNEVF